MYTMQLVPHSHKIYKSTVPIIISLYQAPTILHLHEYFAPARSPSGIVHAFYRAAAATLLAGFACAFPRLAAKH